MQFKKGEQNATIIELQMDLGDLGPASLFELGHELKSKLLCKRENRIEFGIFPGIDIADVNVKFRRRMARIFTMFSMVLKKCYQLILWTSLQI